MVGGSLTVDDFDSLPVGADRRSLCSMRKVQNFMAQSSEALILTDAQGKISAINKPWFDMCGYTADEVDGKTCAILHGQETDMKAVAVFNQQIQNKLPAETTVVNYKKGEEGIFWSCCLCVFSVDKVCFLALATPMHISPPHHHSCPQATCLLSTT